MPKRGIENRINDPRIRQILLIFASPKTPRQAEKAYGSKLKLKPFIQENFLECLNPNARKGRLYLVSKEVRKCFNLSYPETENCGNWEVMGWIVASPRQRLVIMRCVDERKLASEEIRMRATQFNANLTRPATKKTLSQLVQKHLLDSEVLERIRFYWINEFGIKIKQELAVIAPISSMFQ